jgi:selenium metabolism protein YedF
VNEGESDLQETVDARGQACPQPVILTRRALANHDTVTVIVDDPAAQVNVTRMAEKAGCQVSAEAQGSDTYLFITKTSSQSAQPMGERKLVVLITSDRIGRGDPELGSVLLRSFFHSLGESERLPFLIIFVNSGVQMVIDDSPVLEDLRVLSQREVAIWACGTCLKHYGLMDQLAVGQVSNMYSIVDELLDADSVVSL